MKKITIFNIKGGQGKTSIAGNIALTLNAGIITNDIYSPLERILPENQFIKVHPHDNFPDIPEEIPIIYDLGGWIDMRTVPVIKNSDIILIPVINDFVNNQVAISTIEEVQKHNENIILIANRAEKGDYEYLKMLFKRFYGDKFPLFKLKKTTAFSKIFQRKASIGQIVKEDKLLAFAYRQVNEQFNNLINFIEGE